VLGGAGWLASTMSEALLRIDGAGLTFPGTRALSGVDLTVERGEVHAIVGHNGSGKSSLVKILAGEYEPDRSTRIWVDGTLLHAASPRESTNLGLRFVHQDLALVSTLSVTENIAMGAGYGVRGVRRIHWKHEHGRVRVQLAQLGYDIDPRTLLSELSMSARSAVAIARALSDRPALAPKLLILDEVTAAMPQPEITRFLTLVRGLKARGMGIIYVSHHLSEVFAVADRVTVLRDGASVVTSNVGEQTEHSLAEHIVGGASSGVHPQLAASRIAANQRSTIAGRALKVESLSGEFVRDLSFTAIVGSILGIAGIAGSGREEVAELVTGVRARRGTVKLGAQLLDPDRPDFAVRAGLVLLPADRARNGLIPSLLLRENLTISRLRTLWKRAWLSKRMERAEARDWIRRLDIRGGGPDASVTSLSGGNQQKVVIARCLRLGPKALILDEPTQGVDIGGVADIHRLIRQIGEESVVVVCSTDTVELAELCHEVLVLRRDRPPVHLRGPEVTQHNIDTVQLTSGDSPLLSSSRVIP
jgi:ribose transport system ATP-binding protein